jgi:hypothetical protein
LFDFHRAGAIIEFVGDVGGLDGDVADLTDKGYLVWRDVSCGDKESEGE